MELVACDLCGSQESTPVLSGPDRISGRKGCFTVVRCRECGLLYQNPRPTAEAIARFYEGEYHPYAKAIEEESSAIRRWRRRLGMYGRCKVILKRKPPGRLLDVGCGTGIFMAAMRSHGWQVQGVEPNVEAARYGREKLGLEIFAGPLEMANYAEHAFDVVTLWSVLEHLPSPGATLRLLRRLLKPDGLLILRVPNADSLDARLFGPCWAGWDLPRHYLVFDPRSVRRLLGQSGFGAVSLSYEGGYPSLVISCRWWLDERWRRDGRLRRLADWGLENLATRLLAEPFLFVVGPVLKRGTVMTVIAQQVEAV